MNKHVEIWRDESKASCHTLTLHVCSGGMLSLEEIYVEEGARIREEMRVYVYPDAIAQLRAALVPFVTTDQPIKTILIYGDEHVCGDPEYLECHKPAVVLWRHIPNRVHEPDEVVELWLCEDHWHQRQLRARREEGGELVSEPEA